MLRTQISLTEDERQLLDAESARTGRSLSALIRDAVDAVYGGSNRSPDGDLAVLTETFGSWPSEGPDGETFVEQVRSGRRIGGRR